jgi:hypothetical protein
MPAAATSLHHLLTRNRWALTVYASMAAFLVYSCMYAYRKPFAAAGYAWAPDQFGMSFKSVLVLSQLVGYTLSKFMGIRIISELRATQRIMAILGAIALAESALVGFGMAPSGAKWVFMFLNGIPLGLIWGIVFSYVEGRRSTEVIGAVLCTSFIFASGVVKSVGKWLMLSGVPDVWMPAATGAVFSIPLCFAVLMLSKLPPPDANDVRERSLRTPMGRAERMALLRSLAWALVPLIGLYTLLTAYRDMRDNFMADLLNELGEGHSAMVFTATETPVALLVLVSLSLIMFIRDNRAALVVNAMAMALGCLTVAGSAILFSKGHIGPLYWVSLSGLGAYLAYIPFNCILFERLMALRARPGNAGFLIYVADSFGYLISIAVLVLHDTVAISTAWVPFFIQGGIVLGAASLLIVPLSFYRLLQTR